LKSILFYQPITPTYRMLTRDFVRSNSTTFW